MHVISASRRTDIPAFYSDWFMNRIRVGHVRWQNPYGGLSFEASLHPADVLAIVFWSKNYEPLLQHLDELDDLDFRMCFQYTITSLPKIFEPHVPDIDVSIRCAQKLAERYGRDSVLWRYDPIVISSVTSADYHIKRFAMLANALKDVTTRCYISFPTFYGKVLRNNKALLKEHGIDCVDISIVEKIEVAQELANIAKQYEIDMYSCCGDYLIGNSIEKAHCIDAQLLAKLFPDRIYSLKQRPTRHECGCYESKDIGAYYTCPHGCTYCYANNSKELALRNYASHKPNTDMLTGESGIGISSLTCSNRQPKQCELSFE